MEIFHANSARHIERNAGVVEPTHEMGVEVTQPFEKYVVALLGQRLGRFSDDFDQLTPGESALGSVFDETQRVPGIDRRLLRSTHLPR